MAFPLYPFSNILGFLTNGSTSSINVYQHQPSQSLTMDHLLVFLTPTAAFDKVTHYHPSFLLWLIVFFLGLFCRKNLMGSSRALRLQGIVLQYPIIMFANDLIIFSRALPLDIEAIKTVSTNSMNGQVFRSIPPNLPSPLARTFNS